MRLHWLVLAILVIAILMEDTNGVWRRRRRFRKSRLTIVKPNLFKGCYRDKWRRILIGSKKQVVRTNTVDSCIRTCRKQGTLLAGVEFGRECFCGNTLRRYPKVSKSKCNMKCPGNRFQRCGGRWHISVYRTGKKRRCGYNVCHKYAKCLRRRGRRRCKCRRGFVGNGITSCKRKTRQCGNKVCHRNAICSRRRGRRRCKCRRGFVGNGITTCKRENRRCGNNVCHRNAKCSRHRGRRRCKCRRGFVGNGITRCKTKRRQCGYKVCHKYAKCYRQGRRRRCKCRRGFVGNGITSCKKVNPGYCGKCKCHKKAICRRGRCICRRGFFGDGVNDCNKRCVCTASGDPHYRTYDGQWIHFQGICKYLLTAYDNKANPCWFSVAVKNENRGSKRVSFTKLVQIQLPGANIVLREKGSRKEVTINGENVCLPYKKNGQFKVFRSGIHVRVETSCHIAVTWNRRGTVSVAVPKKYKNKLLGICGNCNGKKDDYMTKDGKDVSREKNKYDLIGKSWELIDDTGIKQCIPPVNLPPCTKTMREKADSMNACGMINPKNKMKSPFKACIEEDPAAAQELYNNCVFDYCSFFKKPEPDLSDVICKALEGFSESCENRGCGALWRTKDFCPLSCGKHMEYSAAVSGCPATCVDPHAPLNCDLPETEGCECKSGYILSDSECVKAAECGCRDSSGRYFPLGSKYTTSSCSVQECVVQNGIPILRTDLKKRCGSHATCRLRMGSYHCVCDQGYIKHGSACIRAKCKVDVEAGTSCQLIYKISGSCHFKSYSRSNCQYTVTFEKESGKDVANVSVNAKTYTLKEGQSIANCANFKLTDSGLIVRDRVCSEVCNNHGIIAYVQHLLTK